MFDYNLGRKFQLVISWLISKKFEIIPLYFYICAPFTTPNDCDLVNSINIGYDKNVYVQKYKNRHAPVDVLFTFEY